MKHLYTWDEIGCEVRLTTSQEIRDANIQTGFIFEKRYQNGVRLDRGGHHVALSVRATSCDEARRLFDVDPTYHDLTEQLK